MLPAGILQQVLGTANQVKYMQNQAGSRLAKAIAKAGVNEFHVSYITACLKSLERTYEFSDVYI